jgi:REP element-mobilizing transposase RayT
MFQFVEAAFSLWERPPGRDQLSSEAILEKPHSNSLRQGWQSIVGQYYLLTTTTAGRSPVFADFRAARCCIEAMRFQQQIGRVASLAFVIMPDHVHWLIALQRDNLAKVMQSVKGYTARRINEIAGRSGALWQEGYHDRALRVDEDVRQIARYIVANPLRAGLVARVWDYPHWDAVWVD